MNSTLSVPSAPARYRPPFAYPSSMRSLVKQWIDNKADRLSEHGRKLSPVHQAIYNYAVRADHDSSPLSLRTVFDGLIKIYEAEQLTNKAAQILDYLAYNAIRPALFEKSLPTILTAARTDLPIDSVPNLIAKCLKAAKFSAPS